MDFTWTNEPNMHTARREAILKSHPDVKALFGHDTRTAGLTFLLFNWQMLIAFGIVPLLPTWAFWLTTYAVGATINHTLLLILHEAGHNLIFASPAANKMCAIFANLVTGVPSAMGFRKYHALHHRYLAVDGKDPDLPTSAEARLVHLFPPLKVWWVMAEPLTYALRPLLTIPLPANRWDVANFTVQLAFNALVYYWGGSRPLLYFVVGTLLGMGIHPSAGHFLAEHYEFFPGHETASYYGPMNYVNINVGYHREHHDLPQVPWTRLPLIKKMCPEFYDHLPYHTSYVKLIWQFLVEKTYSLFTRIKRH